MRRVIEFPVEGGGVLLVEVDEPERPGMKPATSAIEKATVGLNQAVSKVKPLAEALLETLKGLSRNPDEVTVEFGIKLDVKAGVLIAETSVQGNCLIRLNWKQPKA